MSRTSGSAQETVVLRPGDIFSKWGFEDGDVLSELVARYADGAGLSLEDGDWRYLDHHRLLWDVYHRFLARPDWEPVLFAHTSHNPIRAVSEWEGLDRVCLEPLEEAPAVEVAASEVLAVCAELFPPRPRWWLELHHALYDLWHGSPPPQLAPDAAPQGEPPAGAQQLTLSGGEGPGAAVADAVVQIVARLSLEGDAARLVARILTQERQAARPWSHAEREAGAMDIVERAIVSARAALS